MPGFWEIQRHRVLGGILHVDNVTLAWAFGLKNLQIPGEFQGVSGMPYDMARNELCKRAIHQGFSHCLRGETMIETDSGVKPIRELVVGDMVKTHLGRYRRVTETMRTPVKGGAPIYWVESEHSKIKATGEHPFFVSRGGAPGKFIRTNELRPGDHMLYPVESKMDTIEFNIPYSTPGPGGTGKKGSVKYGSHLGTIPVTEELARFLGLYVAEGCGCSSGIHMTVGNHEKHLIDLISRVCQILFGRKPTIVSRWATTVSINVRSLCDLFRDWFGKNAHEKKIPEFVLKWNLRNRLSFLRGYLDGDGCVSKHVGPRAKKSVGIQSFSTVSDELVDGVSRLAASCGLGVKKVRKGSQTSTLRSGRTINSANSWVAWFDKQSTCKMKDLLENDSKEGYIHIPVKSVTEKKTASGAKDRAVYNLEVEEDHSYIANCTSVHNCFFLDSDVIAPPDTIHRLLAHNLPVVSGIYCRRSPPHGLPVMIRNGTWITQFQSNSLIEVDWVGAGCLLLSTQLLQSLPPQSLDKPWFSWDVDKKGTGLKPDGECLSEDFSFNNWCRKHGIKTMVDTSIICRHVGYAEAGLGTLNPLNSNDVAR